VIPICLNTDVLQRYPLTHALELAAKAGYTHINLNAIPFWEPHLDLTARDARERLSGLRSSLDRHRLTLAVVEASTNLSAWDERERRLAVDYCQLAIRKLSPLGCQLLCLSAPGTNLLGIDEQRALLETSLREVCATAADAAMRVSLEIYPGSCLEKTADAVRLLEQWQIANLGYTLCVPHVAALGETVIESYRVSRDLLAHAHIADTPLSTVNHKHLVPGDGKVDFSPLFRSLIADGYTGMLTLQIYSCEGNPVDAIERALRKTRSLLVEAGSRDD
jgi:sugar phosphate isomerase/epimerase